MVKLYFYVQNIQGRLTQCNYIMQRTQPKPFWISKPFDNHVISPYILDTFNKCQGIVFFELDVEFILFKFIFTVHFAKNNISYSLGIYEKCLSCICIKFYYWERTEYCFSQEFLGLFLDGKGSLVSWTQALCLSFLPPVFPPWQDIVLCILMVLSWHPKEYTSGLSFLHPNFRSLPKYSSMGSW